MKKILAFLLALASPAFAQSVQQSGNITPGHIASWITTGVIGDGGSVGGGATLSGSFTINDMVCANATSSTPSIVDCGFSVTGTNNWVGVQNLQAGGTSTTVATADNSTNIATTAWVRNFSGAAFPLTQNDILVGSASNFAVGVAMAGDCTIVAAGTITCTKTNGAPFAASATTDTTVATNITSGTLPGARMPALTGDVTSTVNTVSTTIANNAVSNAKLAQETATTFKCNPTGSTANVQDCTGGNFAAIACVPNATILTSGSAQTYTLPTCNSAQPAYLEVEVLGGGSSAPGSGTGAPGNGVAGNASTFIYNSITYTGTGAGQTNAGLGNTPAAGGTGTASSGSCDEVIVGGGGSETLANTASNVQGSVGGASFLGGAGSGSSGAAQTAGTAAANSGSGGGAPGTGTTGSNGAGSGAAGGACRKIIAVIAGQTTGTYTVGAATAGGAAGTNGAIGGGGAAGRVKIVARWQ